MSRPPLIVNPQMPKDAAWLDWASASRCLQIPAEHPAFRPFQAMGVRCLGQDRLKERFIAGTPCSPTHLVWMVTHGAVEVDLGTDTVLLKKGCMVLCPALRPHWVRLATRAARGIWFHFHRQSRWQHLSSAGPAVRPSPRAAEMEWLMEHCISECESREFGAGPNALHYAEILSVMLERELVIFGPRPKEQPVLKRLEKLWGRVLKNPGEKWHVESLATAAGCSSRELYRLCASLYGIGPMGLVTRMRMDRAMELLLGSHRKIDDISREVGYSTAHAFSEAFLAHVGTRPGTFRDAGCDPRNPISKPNPF